MYASGLACPSKTLVMRRLRSASRCVLLGLCVALFAACSPKELRDLYKTSGETRPTDYRKPGGTAQAATAHRLAAASTPLTLASYTPTAAFRGNQVAVIGAAPNPTSATTSALLLRENDCSLTLYAINTALGASTSITATLPGAGAYLHKLAGLTTTAGTFANGCTDRLLGVHPAPVVYLGRAAIGELLSVSADDAGKLTLWRISTQGVAVSKTALVSDGAAQTVAAADLNGDGIADVVAPYITVNGVSGIGVFLSRADGSFNPVVVYPGYAANVSRFYASVSIEDLNGDGKLDIVAIGGPGDSSTSPTVVTLLGSGNGAFTAGTTAVKPIDPGPVVLADFNGDGRVDLLTRSGFLMPGNGDGSFGAPVQRLGGNPNVSVGHLAVGDFNGDGKLDVAARAATTVTIYLGRGDGSFVEGTSYATINGAEHLIVTDIDGDGNADIVIGLAGLRVYGPGNDSYATTQFLMGRGDGRFAGAQAIAGIQRFTLADFNGDGYPDLVAPQASNTRSLALHLGSGTADFAAPSAIATLGFNILQLAAGDLDGDGKPDVVAAGSSLVVLRGQGGAAFAVAQSYALPASDGSLASLAVADFNGDGRADVVVTMGGQRATNGGAYVYFANTDGTLKSPVRIDTAVNLGAVAVGDLNGDGRADLVVAGKGDTQFYTSTDVLIGARVVRGNADGSFTAAQTLAAPTGYTYRALAIGDINKDGKPDLAIAAVDAGLNDTVYVFAGRGDGTFEAPTSLPMGGGGPGITALAIADFTYDGNPDVMIAGGTYTAVLVGKGNTTLDGLNALTIGSRAQTLLAADLNQDGMMDAVVTAAVGGAAVLVRVASALDAGPPPLPPPPPPPPPTDFTLALAPASGSVTSGQSLQTSATVTAAYSFDQSVSFSCSNLPANARCSFSPASMMPVNGSGSSSLTISTGVAPSAAAWTGVERFVAGGGAGLDLIGLGLGAASSRRQRGGSRGLALIVPALLLLWVVVGCGGGSGDSSPGAGGGGGGNPNATPSGTYAVSVTATAGAVVKTAVFSLTVQ